LTVSMNIIIVSNGTFATCRGRLMNGEESSTDSKYVFEGLLVVGHTESGEPIYGMRKGVEDELLECDTFKASEAE
jgi:hypothetical protein